ncbi:MAG: peptidylprolyl isomerase [Gammaproteobacteria bacterium]|nr:peptidylprolyl isomerase [Gammaproteobacteria bacterium]
MTEKIEPGKFVSLTYIIKDKAGSVLEHNDIPTGYIFGGDTELLGGMDELLIDKQAGDEISSEIPPAKGFGEYNPAMVFVDDLENVPEDFRHVGAEVQMQNDRGESRSFYVSKIKDGKLVVDGNHPLAGKTLTLEVKILEVRDATEADFTEADPETTNKPTLN